MLTIRTDLAMEAHQLWREKAGETTKLSGLPPLPPRASHGPPLHGPTPRPPCRWLAKVIGYGVDMALQPGLEVEDLEALLA